MDRSADLAFCIQLAAVRSTEMPWGTLHLSIRYLSVWRFLLNTGELITSVVAAACMMPPVKTFLGGYPWSAVLTTPPIAFCLRRHLRRPTRNEKVTLLVLSHGLWQKNLIPLHAIITSMTPSGTRRKLS